MRVELVTHNKLNAATGIGRYASEMYAHLAPRIDVRLVQQIDPPLARQFPILHHFPLGIWEHSPGSIAHFTQIMGCSQMLWNAVHPAVATVHDLGVLVEPADSVLFNRVDRWVLDAQLAGLKRMDRYAVNSEKTRTDLVAHLGVDPAKIHFVQLGVDSDYFRPIPDAAEQIKQKYQIQLPEDTFWLIYVGSELPRKNMRLLLESLACVRSRGYRASLLKIGRPGGERWREQTLHDIERLGLGDSVLLMDLVPGEDLPLFYNLADLCVTTTLLEGGFAWVAMEGMACGKPVVASAGALIPEAVRDVVTVVPEYEPEAFAENIIALIDDEEQRRIRGQRGRELITSYSWKNTAESMIELYRHTTGN